MSKLEDVSIQFRNCEVAKNKFSYSDEYTIGNPDEISPIGKDQNASTGSVGSAADIKARQTLIAKNDYGYGKEYNSGND